MASPTVLPCSMWQLYVWSTLEEPNMSDHHFAARSLRSPHKNCQRIGPIRSLVDADEVEIFVPPNGPGPIVVENLRAAIIGLPAVAYWDWLDLTVP